MYRIIQRIIELDLWEDIPKEYARKTTRQQKISIILEIKSDQVSDALVEFMTRLNPYLRNTQEKHTWYDFLGQNLTLTFEDHEEFRLNALFSFSYIQTHYHKNRL